MYQTRRSLYDRSLEKTFGRVLLLISRGVNSTKEISRILHHSERLIGEYLELFKKHKGKGRRWPAVYLELLEQLTALYPAKKRRAKGVGNEDQSR